MVAHDRVGSRIIIFFLIQSERSHKMTQRMLRSAWLADIRGLLLSSALDSRLLGSQFLFSKIEFDLVLLDLYIEKFQFNVFVLNNYIRRPCTYWHVAWRQMICVNMRAYSWW